MNSHAFLHYMQFNQNMDDSDGYKLTWLKAKLQKQWDKISELEGEDDWWGNQILIDQLLDRIDLLTNLINHYIYN